MLGLTDPQILLIIVIAIAVHLVLDLIRRGR